MKATYYTWGIGALLGAILSLTFVDQSSQTNIQPLPIGITIGVILGLMVGLILDNFKKTGSSIESSLPEHEQVKLKKAMLGEVLQSEMDRSISSFIHSNPKIVHDPILGPMGILDQMNNTSEILRKSAERGKVFNLSEEEFDEVIKKVYTRSYKKFFR